jgi:type II secretory pathway component PulL
MNPLKAGARARQYLPSIFSLVETIRGELDENEEVMYEQLIELLLVASKVDQDTSVDVIHGSFRRAREIHPKSVWWRAKTLAPVFVPLGIAGAIWDEAIDALMAMVD